MAKKNTDMYTGVVYESNNYGSVEVLEYVNKTRVKIRYLNTGNISYEDSRKIRTGQIKDASVYNIYGVARNDADYNVYKTTGGTKTRCKYYQRGHHMIARCYSGKPAYFAYSDCTVHKDWLNFSKFKEWLEVAEATYNYDYEGAEYHLDKDLLKRGNRVYSAKTCCLLPAKVNIFLTCSNRSNVNTCWDKDKGNWASYCRDAEGKSVTLGHYSDRSIAKAVATGYKISVAYQLTTLLTNDTLVWKLKQYFKGVVDVS